MFHALVPLNEDGSFKAVDFGDGVPRSGKQMFDYIDAEVKRLYFAEPSMRKTHELDLMWYLWCGPDSPLFGKNKMTTFERVEIDDSKSHKEKRNAYYKYQDTKDLAIRILNEFGITDTDRAVIVNGHIPVEKSTARIRLKRAEALSSLTAASQSTIKKPQVSPATPSFMIHAGCISLRMNPL